jgi:uncharacterized OB-fold protein
MTELFPSADAWIEEGGQVHLVGGRCATCRKVAFPRRATCDECGHVGEPEPVRLSRSGRLYSFSEVHTAPAGFPTPYTIGYVDLPEGVRVLGQIENPAGELGIDEPVEVVLGTIRTLPDGQPVVSYKFRKQGGTSRA